MRESVESRARADALGLMEALEGLALEGESGAECRGEKLRELLYRASTITIEKFTEVLTEMNAMNAKTRKRAAH
jgi:hypothetical protein